MPETELLLPRFLTKSIAERAMSMAISLATSEDFRHDLSRSEGPMFHIVMLVPSMEVTAGKYPDYPIKPYVLAEYSYGDKAAWPHDFANIAQCKALQRWHERNYDGIHVKSHLLFPGDTPFNGSVKKEGIVVASSGDKPWNDSMVSGIAAEIAITLAHNAKVAWSTAHPKEDWV